MNKIMPKCLLLFFLAVAISGCKLELMVSSGGDVNSSLGTGTRSCSGPDFCEFEITDASFSETFTALPRPGYEFVKWQDGSGFHCASSTDPNCSIALSGDSLSQVIITFFASSSLRPLFKDVGIDTDGDGVRNELDEDDDNDGLLDEHDPYPLEVTPPAWYAVDANGDILGPVVHESDEELHFKLLDNMPYRLEYLKNDDAFTITGLYVYYATSTSCDDSEEDVLYWSLGPTDLVMKHKNGKFYVRDNSKPTVSAPAPVRSERYLGGISISGINATFATNLVRTAD